MEFYTLLNWCRLYIAEVVSILSSDEEDVGSADGSLPNVNPSPSTSRSNTPVQNAGNKTRKKRMEDKVILGNKLRIRLANDRLPIVVVS